MIKNNNLTLEMLDAYAKTLTSKQTNMLYENRMKKPYVKHSLNEAFEPDADTYFTVIVPREAVDELGDTPVQLIVAIVQNRDYIKYKMDKYSLYFYTEFPQDYKKVLEILVSRGYSDAIRDNIDQDFADILEPKN